ncbi:MAG: pyruvate dehydrogenase (acetyl-transferring) E1 component subunit alpha [Candidatus Thiodiazotropha sp. (ex Monitilora ramsayi)]|nr:pyruvate dehydrogenase (acetyl-transferring) E1 component subunit alpha [Candidatus Thiodiazotropha sp. (ex Monitilora ramsayi)]
MSAHKTTIKLTSAHRVQRDGPETVARFEIHYHQYLNAQGEPVHSLPDFASDPDRLARLYRAMLLTRVFDTKAIALQRTGQLGTYASSMGQEAIGAAIGTVMRDDDVLLPTYREYAAQFLRGVSISEILLYWGGDERGMNYQRTREDFPISVPVASQTAHAVGVAYAFKYRKQPRVAVCVLGDGGTSKGDFYEALNLAGVWKLPVLFVVNNNQWAISVQRDKQTAATTLAQKAIAGGIQGEQVDGNDVIALCDRMQLALDRIRDTHEPMLIEALTYRLCDHTTADDANRYRPEEEVEAQRINDPLRRLKHYMVNNGYWNDQKEEQLNKACIDEVDAAVKAYLETPPQPPESMFDYLYEELPDALKEQRSHAAGRKRDD